MRKSFTTLNQQWDEDYKSHPLPENCLACTIKNDGESLVLIDDVIELSPGQAFQIPAIAGYYLSATINVKVLKTTTPFGKTSKVTFRNAVEI